VTLINKDQSADVDVTIAADRAFLNATALRLKGHALDSADDVSLGGSVVAADGGWRPTDIESLNIAGGVCEVQMPAASAAVVTCRS
jgi:hypothetical protein